ncbi:MAG: 2Fe-2S iron-sulfur cluster-binding protein, partial [Candidatus Bipolaricaulota bacterium]
MDKVRVRFLPSGEVVHAQPGSTLLELAREAGISISAVCGGDGICGGCRVVIQDGEVEASPTTLLTRDEIRRGYALACQTRVRGDAEVLVPPESRSEGAQILLDEDAQRFRALLPVDEEGV